MSLGKAALASHQWEKFSDVPSKSTKGGKEIRESKSNKTEGARKGRSYQTMDTSLGPSFTLEHHFCSHWENIQQSGTLGKSGGTGLTRANAEHGWVGTEGQRLWLLTACRELAP